MNIIIAGAGKVGFNLAKTLSIGHNVTIIDQNSEALHRIQESLDIMPMRGDVEDTRTYESFKDKNIDLFIAVTNIDDVNLISAIVADTVLNIDKKFVRLEKQFFNGDKIKNKLGIDKLIFPIHLASEAISSLLAYPKANNIKNFKYTDFKLVSIKIPSKFIPQEFKMDRLTIVGIERKKEFFIPNDENVEIFPNDLVYIFGSEVDINILFDKIEPERNINTQKCVVFGGARLGVAIAKQLVSLGRDVKLVEKDLKLCEQADEDLEGKASIINSKYSSYDIFEDEGLDSADIFIAATSNDEFNIIKCLEAREIGIKRVVAINNEMEYYNLMHSLGITVVRGPKMSAYSKIMEEIGSAGVILQKSFCGAKAIVFMRKVFVNSRLVGTKVKALKIEESSIFCMRDALMLPLHERLVLQENDLIITFCTTKESTKVKQWIYEL